MQRVRRPAFATVAGVLVLLVPSRSRADSANYRLVPVGARAAGMGGAFTALADDGAGTYYNPGGLAFSSASSLSLFASAYALLRGRFERALGDNHDFTYQNLDAIPVATAAVFKFGPTQAGGGQRHSLALTAFVPDAQLIDDRDSLGSHQNAFFFTFDSKTIWVGATYALRLGRLGLGAGAHLLIGEERTQFDITVADASGTPFSLATARTDETTIGLVAAFGARYDATERLHFGAALFTPAVGGGNRRVFARAALGESPSMGTRLIIVNEDRLGASPTLPLRLQLGAAFTGRRATLSADVVAFGPREVIDDADRAADGLERRVVRHPVVNGSLGAEILLRRTLPLRLGVFTDLSASPEPQSIIGGTQTDLSKSLHDDRAGVTASIGYRAGHTATDLGLIYAHGWGRNLVPNNLNFADLEPADSSQDALSVFAASSYEF
jgi:long-chain fatty acid transport protein